MKINRQSLNPLSGAIDLSADLDCCARKSAQTHRLSWRNTLDWLTSPAFRLHHYRNVHTQMLRGALCTVDCGHTHHNRDDSDNE